ncbi:MAG: guanylate kinase [Candidatus Eremiobacteraeota bacterium]|nr:guanylate kinase [Candidatus Eremiobacteraeota bacterium]
MRGLLLVVSGPSGVGKGTLLNLLLSQRDDCVFSVSATTRPPRPGEQDKVHYYFLDGEVFSRWVEEGRFLEWNKVFDRFYGTPLEPVEEHLRQGKNVVLDVDVQGGVQVIENRPDAVSVFVAPPDLSTLKTRLTQRGTEPPDEIALRLLTAKSELKAMTRYQYLLINDSLESTRAQLNAIIEAESCRISRLMKSDQLPQFEG